MKEKVIFRKNNKIPYWQDFSDHLGLPAKVGFEVEDISNNRVFLRAEGYGNLKGNYGNGGISIALEDFEYHCRPSQPTNLKD